MRVIPTGFDGLVLVEPRRFGDERGFFLESYHRDRYAAHGMVAELVQDNHSRSVRGVLRGMHFQVKRPQAQLVTVMRGTIYDAAVDLRSSSPTFGTCFGATLSSDGGPQQLFMAPGFAHGFYVLSDVADLHYKVSRYYDHEDEGGLLWNDPDVNIRWPLQPSSVAPRDAAFPAFRDLTADRLPHDPPVERTP